jgi:hypothetical protein
MAFAVSSYPEPEAVYARYEAVEAIRTSLPLVAAEKGYAVFVREYKQRAKVRYFQAREHRRIDATVQSVIKASKREVAK